MNYQVKLTLLLVSFWILHNLLFSLKIRFFSFNSFTLCASFNLAISGELVNTREEPLFLFLGTLGPVWATLGWGNNSSGVKLLRGSSFEGFSVIDTHIAQFSRRMSEWEPISQGTAYPYAALKRTSNGWTKRTSFRGPYKYSPFMLYRNPLSTIHLSSNQIFRFNT